MFYKVPQELVQSLLDYLKKQPYEEVVGFINHIMKVEKIQEDPPIKDLAEANK